MNRLWAKEIMPPCTHTISVFGKEYALKCRKEAVSLEKLIIRFRVQKQINDIDGVLVGMPVAVMFTFFGF